MQMPAESFFSRSARPRAACAPLTGSSSLLSSLLFSSRLTARSATTHTYMYIDRPVYGPHDTLDRGGGPCRRARLLAYLHARYKPAPLYRKAIESGFIFLLSTYTSSPVRSLSAARFAAGPRAVLHFQRVGVGIREYAARVSLAGDSGIYAGTEDRIHRYPGSASISLSLSLSNMTRHDVIYRVSRMAKDISSTDPLVLAACSVKYILSANFMENIL